MSKKETKTGKKLGRPCLYREEYDTQIIEYAKKGLFLYEIAVKFDISYKVMREWTERYDTFRAAYTRATTIIDSKLERSLFETSLDKMKNSRPIEFILESNRNQRQYGGTRLKGIKSSSLDDKVNALYNALEKNDIRPDQLKMVADSIKTLQEVKSGQETINKIKELIKSGKSKDVLEMLEDS